jgi:hypothetical protein
MSTMKKISRCFLVQICCLLIFSIADAQVKNSVSKLHAYITKTVAGNIQTDSSGNELTSAVEYVHHVYAETTGKYLPQWNMVFTNNGVYAIQASEVESGKHEVGQLENGSKLSIAAKRGNRLWRLELVPVKARIPSDIDALLKTNDVVVTTEWNGTRFTHTIAELIELKTIYYK